MRKKRVSLKFLLDNLDKILKRYRYGGIFKEVFIDNPRYKYKVFSKNKQSRSLLNKIKSYVILCERIEPEPVSLNSREYPNLDEINVRFSSLVREVKGEDKINFNYSAMQECVYIGHGIAHPTRFGKFTIDPYKPKDDADMKKEILNNWIGETHV